MATLAEIRAKLVAQENKQENNNNRSQGANALYPFWNMDNDTSATLRFLPDGDTNNDFFWRERQVIKLPFSGVKGVAENKPVTIQVPCVEMWGEQCPVLAQVRPWYKDPSLEKMAGKYWKKRSYIFQGFVVNDPIGETETPENPIRRFVISPQIFKVLKSALMDPDMENMPTDYDAGTDFRITKTQNGQYADYSTSNWARKERSLDEAERTAIEEFGLNDLNDFMPKKPSAEELRVIEEMFEASVDGELYDPERWANFYKPYGVDLSAYTTNSGSTETQESATKTVKVSKPETTETNDAPFDVDEKVEETASASGASQHASDLLAQIRARGKS